MWLHSMGDIKKVASCKVKPYELVERKVPDSDQDPEKQVMLEDGLKDVKSVQLEEEESEDEDRSEGDDDLDKDLRNDSIGANYLRMDNSF